jgi:hypothetical protein
VLTGLTAHSSFQRKNVTLADSKPEKSGRNPASPEMQVVTAKAGWIPTRAALGRNDGAWNLQGDDRKLTADG